MNNFIMMSLELLKNGKDILELINIAFLTILIPVAIAIFNKRELDVLDKNVILDNVINAKYFLFYIALMFLPLFFWGISKSIIAYCIIFFIWGIGVCFIIKILIKSYHWLNGNKFSIRFDYLRKLKNLKDLEESWRSVWETEKINSQNEQNFFEIFTNIIDNKLFTNKTMVLKTISKLLNDFNNFVDNRSTYFLVKNGEVLTKILEWHFKVWIEIEECSKSRNKSLRSKELYSSIPYYLKCIYGKIEKRFMKENLNNDFIEHFRNHVEKCKNQFDANNKYYAKYVKYLFSDFYRVFFENIGDSYAWGNYFPQEWKITKTNLENNIISWESFLYFIKWAKERILNSKEDYDVNLDNVLINLFPEVEPIIWARILTFAIFPDIKLVISLKWNFGLLGRFNVKREDVEDINADAKKYINNTFELANSLFPKLFSKENVKKYIKEINSLEYEKGSIEEHKILQLRDIFTEMLEYDNKIGKSLNSNY